MIQSALTYRHVFVGRAPGFMSIVTSAEGAVGQSPFHLSILSPLNQGVHGLKDP